MIIYVDLDNTLCHTEGTKYQTSTPIQSRIDKINRLYSKNRIVIYTARGSGSGIDYTELTKSQLESWGVQYHELSVGKKPVFDLLIDDKAISDKEFFQ